MKQVINLILGGRRSRPLVVSEACNVTEKSGVMDVWGTMRLLCDAIQPQQRQIECLHRAQAHLLAATHRILQGILADDPELADIEALRRTRTEIAELEKLWDAGGEAQA